MKKTNLLPLIAIGAFCLSVSGMSLATTHHKHRPPAHHKVHNGIVHNTVKATDRAIGTAGRTTSTVIRDTGRTVERVGRDIDEDLRGW